ncbi:STAS domain-containing protein [Aliiglaciecola sp. CAU 1673]|uniref:STAS domain-containing protein n=1 Tax=Aliiglaciecola sp. CAU 1673 TaxID=3032595 RepID=UPI0023DCE6AC|nr:STAS domain-containing protein [Aliiglaciecola sp. CAU 1673]MDF2178466.1 STAS domain-containing protein [Aliiglaciecola sp. CAU 1673]
MGELSLREQGDAGQFILSGKLTRNTVMSLVGELAGLWQHKAPCLDLAELTATDTAGLAWLVSVVADAKQRQVELKLENPPQSLLKLAKISDVESLLPLQ